MRQAAMVVAGERRWGARRELVRSPWDLAHVGEVAVGEAHDIDAAIERAHAARAQLREWPVHARAALLQATAERMRARADELARLIALESGKPIALARHEVARAALTFELSAGEARTFGGATFPVDLEPRGEGRLGFTVRVSRGVVAALAPFNFPLNLVAHKLAPALAVGSPVILKPAPQCPLTALWLVEWLLELGAPSAALSALHCAPEVAERMVRDERVAVLSFTGSDRVGWHLKSLAGRKQVLLELGGNAPCIVDASVDVAAIAKSVALAAFAHAGQVCVKAQRVLVHESVRAEFERNLLQVARSLPCGDPLDERTLVGPMIDESAALRISTWIGEARAGGARVLCGGARTGRLVEPTVLADVAPHARVCTEEIFGPVATLESWRDFDDALERCNATRYGLQVGLFTRDLGRALQAVRTLEYGGVIVNDTSAFRIDSMPYGGTKASGIGREGPRSAMEELTEPRTVVLRPAP
ncbi:MAG: aldehyde dehydrogenase family protein [Planctomycetes bacterium]|nr:aldehyde dehydrogenase family protein [Planctomycetota bacterium]